MLPTLILLLILCPLLGRNELFSNLSASNGRSCGSVKLIHSRHAHLGLIHHGLIRIIFPTLLQFLHLGVMLVKISHETSHAINVLIEIKFWGLALHTRNITNVLSREVTKLTILRVLTAVFNVLRGLLQALSVLFLPILVLLADSLLLLLLKINLLLFLSNFGDSDHFPGACIEIFNVDI